MGLFSKLKATMSHGGTKAQSAGPDPTQPTQVLPTTQETPAGTPPPPAPTPSADVSPTPPSPPTEPLSSTPPTPPSPPVPPADSTPS